MEHLGDIYLLETWTMDGKALGFEKLIKHFAYHIDNVFLVFIIKKLIV